MPLTEDGDETFPCGLHINLNSTMVIKEGKSIMSIKEGSIVHILQPSSLGIISCISHPSCNTLPCLLTIILLNIFTCLFS